jgi:hypothetical protein
MAPPVPETTVPPAPETTPSITAEDVAIAWRASYLTGKALEALQQGSIAAAISCLQREA